MTFNESDHPRNENGRFTSKYKECESDFLNVTPSKAEYTGKNILDNWKKENPKGLKCKVLSKNVRIEKISFFHLFYHKVKGKIEKRDIEDIARRVSCLPVAKEIIEDKGVLVERRNTDGFIYEALRGTKNGKFIDVVISTDKKNNSVYISVFPREDIKKSVSANCDFRGNYQTSFITSTEKTAFPVCHLGSSFEAGSPYDKYGNYKTADTVARNIAESMALSSFWQKLYLWNRLSGKLGEERLMHVIKNARLKMK